MSAERDFDWFSLARQPQEPPSKDGATLAGEDLKHWKKQFSPLLRFLRRKRVVVALSGGGMAMSCHVSVLRVLELLGVPVAAIYGTSAGAVIGGLRAAGLTVAQLEEVMLDITHPDELFGFAARHPAMRLVAGEVIRAFAGRSFDRAGVYDSTRLGEYLSNLLQRYAGGAPKFSDLAIPFSCVAFDIGTGRPEPQRREKTTKCVFCRETSPDLSLADAIGASMAIPGTLPPKKIGSRFYIDGATVEHLPIATAFHDWQSARRLGRRRTAVIAVDLGYGGNAPREEAVSHPMSLVLYSNSIQSRAITDYNLLHCHRPRRGFSVILLRPRTIGVGLCDIEKIPSVMKTAYEETLRQLSGSGFLDLTAEHTRRATAFLGLGDPGSPDDPAQA
ncbi:MAG: patatin-like phospholipase family protein [Candidatus Eisenbacteria sp.]|jgi:NTE family protein|nr:patatin-like phospholipase family protein [Candidatus Eisenbacteria bacterium]